MAKGLQSRWQKKYVGAYHEPRNGRLLVKVMMTNEPETVMFLEGAKTRPMDWVSDLPMML
jgi:hypothetical protein